MQGLLAGQKNKHISYTKIQDMLLVKKRLFSNLKELADGIFKGDRSSLARGITLGIANKSRFCKLFK